MRFSMLYSGEQILSFKSCLVFYAGDSLSYFFLKLSTCNIREDGLLLKKKKEKKEITSLGVSLYLTVFILKSASSHCAHGKSSLALKLEVRPKIF